MTLRSAVLRGGGAMVARQGIGTVVGVAGVIVLTRLLGPAQYGIFIAANGVVLFAQGISQWGIGLYLVRHEGGDVAPPYSEAFTFLAITGMAVGLFGIALSYPLAGWIHQPAAATILAAMFCGVPISAVAQVPLARLERELRYEAIATIELASQLAFYVIALPLAGIGYGAGSLVLAWWAQLATSVLATFALAKMFPRVSWNRKALIDLSSYGFAYSASTWIWQVRNLVNPLIVGRFAGAAAVGQVALTIRIVEALSLVKTVTYRISLAALSQIQFDKARVARIIGEGARLQVLSVGVPLLLFVFIAPWLINALLGEQWNLIAKVYPYVALGCLANSMFNLHSSALYVMRRNWDVARFHLAYVALFGASAGLLVPSLGVMGYAYAELMALPAYLVIHGLMVAAIGPVRLGTPMIWAAALGLGFFATTGRLWVLAGTPLLVLSPAIWAEISGVLARARRQGGLHET